MHMALIQPMIQPMRAGATNGEGSRDEASGDAAVRERQPEEVVGDDHIEGLDSVGGSWGDYPIDELLIRRESRTVYEVIRRIENHGYVMDPEFQRDFIWSRSVQSKLIESVVMRIPLPVFYMAEDAQGRMIVVDGLQRLSTFRRFLAGDLALDLPDREELHRKRFQDLPARFQNRVEDCNLIFYIIDSKVLERARLDIFERVNSGVPLSRQQMRNCLFMGEATRFLRDESRTEIFLEATGKSLKTKMMRDREFVNRFCAFQILDLDEYRGDMDEFLAQCLKKMNMMERSELSILASQFRNALNNNLILFGKQAFRKHEPEQSTRGIVNASLWDVMSTELSRHPQDRVRSRATFLRDAVYGLLRDNEFNTAITYGPNDPRKVKTRFSMARNEFEEILGVHEN